MSTGYVNTTFINNLPLGDYHWLISIRMYEKGRGEKRKLVFCLKAKVLQVNTGKRLKSKTK